MTQSITIGKSPTQQYVLRLADTCLILAQRLGEWTGHAPILEEDIALANMALDLLGQSRALLTHAGRLDSQGHDEDQLAFLRDERDFVNMTLVELPRGDFAFTVLRNLMVSTWLKLVWERLADSSDDELAAIAGKAIKEARYHQQHAADWTVRLGDGTEESTQRMKAALETLWPYTAELFADDAIDEAAAANGVGPKASALRDAWLAEMTEVLSEAMLTPPADTPFVSEAKRGRHTEHMGYILAEMQYLQRAYPGGVW
jgi:ring-1,2-phenylacetyl-CoA epoxidase subunit PaaC